MSGSLAASSTSQAHWRNCADRRSLSTLQTSGPARTQQQRPCRREQQRCAAAASSHAAGDSSFTGAQAILDRYRAMLHEYRTHKDALGEWLTRTSTAQRRHPQLSDAEATGDPVLVSRFQQYLMVRKRLLAEIPLLRDQLAAELQLQQQPHAQAASSNNYQQHRRRPGSSNGSSGGHHTHAYGVVNANQAAPVSKVQAVGQFFAAVNYRKQRSARDSNSSSSSSEAPAEQQPQPAVAAAVAAGTGNEQQLAVSSVLPAAGADVGKDAAVSHLLQAATNSSSSSAGNNSSRAASAAMAALNYKQKQQGGAGAGSGSSSMSGRQQRPLAMQLTESPPPPPGYKPGGSSTSSSSVLGQEQQSVVVGSVETAKGDVYAGRLRRQLDKDVSLETTLQGVPGGLGSEQMFAVAHSAPADEVVTSSSRSGAVNNVVVDAAAKAAADALLAAAAREAAASSAPVGLVVTAKFDAYSGRQRKLQPDAQLDDFFASLEQAHSVELAAAAAAAVGSCSGGVSSTAQVPAAVAVEAVAESSSAVSSEGSSSSGVAAGKQAKSQKRVGFGSSSSNDAVMALPVDIIPLPT